MSSCVASKWWLVGEGKTCIAVVDAAQRYAPSSCLLIFRKTTPSCPVLDIEYSMQQDIVVIENIMRKWFGHSYVSDKLEIAMLPQEVARDMTRSVEGDRIEYRKVELPQLQVHHIGLLIRNFNTIYKTVSVPIINDWHQLAAAHNMLSLELKVKCGLPCRSPLVAEQRSFKLFRSRFWVMQLYKAELRGTRGKLSTYDPCGLCSLDFSRIKAELQHLLKDPQNNFRVTYGGRKHFGDDLTSIDELHTLLSAFLNGGEFETVHGSCKTNSCDFMLGAWSSLLCRERLLERLEAMQALDLIDIDGAALVYHKLVTLVGSMESVDAMLAEAMTIAVHPDGDPQLLQTGLTLRALARGNKTIDNAMFETHAAPIIATFARLQLNADMTPQECAHCRRAALEVLEDLSVADGVLLLRLWLLALTAKDASVILTMKPAWESSVSQFIHGTFAEVNRPMHVICQTVDSCGVLLPFIRDAGTPPQNLRDDADSNPTTTSAGGDHCKIALIYSMGVTDIGLKPVNKCWKKVLEEDAVLKACSNYLKRRPIL